MNADNKVIIAALGGIDDVLKAMRENTSDVEVQYKVANLQMRGTGRIKLLHKAVVSQSAQAETKAPTQRLQHVTTKLNVAE